MALLAASILAFMSAVMSLSLYASSDHASVPTLDEIAAQDIVRPDAPPRRTNASPAGRRRGVSLDSTWCWPLLTGKHGELLLLDELVLAVLALRGVGIARRRRREHR